MEPLMAMEYIFRFVGCTYKVGSNVCKEGTRWYTENKTRQEMRMFLWIARALLETLTVCNVILKARVGRSELKASQIVGRDYT